MHANLTPFGIQIIVSDHCLKDADERLFPISRNRSRRIHKKLVKRFGGEFRKVPAIYKTASAICCHPTIYHQLKAEVNASL